MKRLLKWSAILLGLLLVVVALVVFVFPSAVANAARGWIEDDFAQRFHGRVKLGELELAWSSPQTIRSVELFDEQGTRILATTIVAPSIRQLLDGQALGKAKIELEADLVADDAGVTNLERALAPRERAPSEPDSAGGSSEPTDWRQQLAALDVEVELVSKRITWSDSRTRAAGRTIALENLGATAKLEHGERAELKLGAELVDDSPRPLALDAVITHPFAAPDAADPPTLELQADLRELPTGLVDGLAGLGGLLTQALGPEVTLVARGSGTAQSGSLDFELTAARATVEGAVELSEGVLRGVGEEPLRAELQVDAELVQARVTPLLPPGLALERPAPGRVTVKLTRLGVRLEDVLTKLAQQEPAATTVLDASDVAVSFDLGGWRVRDAASGLDVGIAQFFGQLDTRGVAGLDPSAPRIVPCNAAMFVGLEGTKQAVALRVQALDVRGLAAGSLNGVAATWDLAAPELPTALLAQLGAPAAEGLGLKASGDVGIGAPVPGNAPPSAATAAANSTAAVPFDLGLVHGEAKFELTATRVPLAEGLALGATQVTAHAKLADTVSVDARGTLELDAGRSSTFELVATTSAGLAKLVAGEIPASSVKLTANELPLALADRFTGDAYALAKRLGASANVALDASGDLTNATAKLDFTSEHAALAAELALAQRALTLGAGGVKLAADVDAATVAELAGPALPAGFQLAPGGGQQRITLDVTELSTSVDAWLPKAPEAPLDLAAALGATRAQARLGLGAWNVADATLIAAGRSLALSDLGVVVELSSANGATPAKLALDARLADAPDGRLALNVDVADATELLALGTRRAFGKLGMRLDVPACPVALAEAYTGPLGGKFGERIGLELAVTAEWPRGERLKSRVDCVLAAATPTRIAIDASVADPFAALEQGVVPEAELVLDVTDPALALGFVPAEYREIASDALGAQFGLKVENRASAGSAQSFRVALDAPGAKFDVAGVLDGRTFRASGADRLAASLPLRSKTLQPLLAAYLPAGVGVELVSDGEALSFSASELELPLDAWLPAPGAEPEPLANALDRAKAKLELSLPTLRVRAPAVTTNGAPVDVTLRGLAVRDVEFAPGKLVGARVTGQLDATPPGSIELRASGEHPFGLLATADAAGNPSMGPKPKLVLDGDLKSIPTALVDALAAQDGLVVDVLGAGADVKLRGVWPPEGGDALSAEMHSSNADFKVAARAEDGVLKVTGEQALDASLIVTPLFGERVVGSLVPLLADVRQVPGSKRALLTGRNLALPLSGDLRQLSGEITFDPGALEYRFLPGLAEMFGDEAARAMSSAKLEPVQVKIDKGVARYERLAVPIGGQVYAFKGSFDIVERAYKLEVELPLAALGKSVKKSLEGAADFLDPATKIPLEIRGTTGKPKVRIAEGFLKKALEDAAERALEKKLKGLFDDKDKKKKKKE
ncbi:MAG: hypothetical protein L6Q99_10375 [Planctomycetes bacterium]|nr:hypothetical protein [Planctomycetota bacterium]